MSTTGISDDKTGSSVHAFIFPDEGFARLQVFDMQYEIDRQIMEDNFCQSCLDSVNELSYLGVVAEYAVISFQEQTIHPLTQSLPWFSAGNYGVDCEYGDEVKLLVHYLQNNK